MLMSRSAHHRRRRRSFGLGTSASLEHLEARRLLSKTPVMMDYTDVSKSHPVELRPDLIDPKTGLSAPTRVADPATIVWTNRANTTTGGAGDTDGFGAIFGTVAPTARAVVDAVIADYQRMIVSFDYPLANQTYSLSLSMAAANSGFGASAGLSSTLGGKPKSGSIQM